MTELKLQQCRLDGRYDILECLGRGSYAEIYVARDTAAAIGEPQTIVIKALNLLLQGVPDTELERTLIENFQNEAVALDRVRHPNIINRLGHGTAIDLSGTTFHYLVLEYLPGGDMAALCRKQPLPLSRALFYLEQVCAGLAHAHECGVIHRDVKPQNLLLTADRETVKIADFGVAKLEATEGVITRVGTNVYAAPEHNPLGQTGPLDPSRLTERQLTPAADIYSLAKTTYTLLVGEPPRRFSHREISELPPELAAQPWASSVLRVLCKATQNAPRDRYQTVQEFWEDLADASLPPTQPLQRPDSEPRRRPSASRSEVATKAPPRPVFNSSQAVGLSNVHSNNGVARPRIVVSMAQTKAELAPAEQQQQRNKPNAREILTALPDAPQKDRQRTAVKSAVAGRGLRALVAMLIIIVFAGMLLATHFYVKNRRAQNVAQQPGSQPTVVGREGKTITDVNLRPEPSTQNDPVGLAEQGSRVRVLNINNNWYEVQVIEHGRDKIKPDSLDRGWVHKKFLDFN